MLFETYIGRKFYQISKFIEKERERIDADPEFKKTVLAKARRWAMLGAFLMNDNLKIGEVIDHLNEIGLEGVLKFRVGSARNTMTIASAASNYTPSENEKVFDPESATLETVSKWINTFDATIEEVGTKK